MRFILTIMSVFIMYGCTDKDKNIEPITTTTQEIINQIKCIDKTTKNNCTSIKLTLDKTNKEWLNNYLLNEIVIEDSLKDKSYPEKITHLENLAKKSLEETFQEIKEFNDEYPDLLLNYDTQEKIEFLEQTPTRATFVYFTYAYTGGAHGMHSTKYLNYDLTTKQLIKITDIINKANQDKLFKVLKAEYKNSYPDYYKDWLPNNINDQKELLLIDNFYYEDDNLVFVYPLYQLGPYSEGEIKLTLLNKQLTEILN